MIKFHTHVSVLLANKYTYMYTVHVVAAELTGNSFKMLVLCAAQDIAKA